MRLLPAVALCVVIWTDSYPVYAPGDRLWQDVKVEVCDRVVLVSSRVVREVQTVTGPVREPVGDWRIVASGTLRLVVDPDER